MTAGAQPHFRAHPRRRVHLRVLVAHPHRAWQREALVLDVSLGGAALILDEEIASGDRVILTFVAPTLWDPLTLPARVAWSKRGTRPAGTRFGVAFEPQDAAAAFGFFDLTSALPVVDD